GAGPVVRREVEGAGERHAILPPVYDELLFGAGQERSRIDEMGEREHFAGGEIADEVVGRLAARLAARQDARGVVVEDGDDGLEVVGVALPDPDGLEGPQAEPVEERPFALRRGAIAGEEDPLAVLEEDRSAGAGGSEEWPAGIAVAVLHAAVPEEARLRAPTLEIEDPRPRLAAGPVDLGEERDAIDAPLDPGVAVLGLRDLSRVPAERGVEGEDPVTVLDLAPGITAVERLGPHEGRRRERLPGDGAGAGPHAADGDTLGEGEAGELVDDTALGVPDLDDLGECRERDQVRIGSDGPGDEEELAVGRGLDVV